ncbi:MAG TPA: SDR family oxidoreductase [Vicinamibacterales bacterium]|nr:SDR family oxidoreductase [Vicinamibacterales bacterium]
MICITGAGGTLSSEVIRHLGQAVPFRAAYFSERAAAAARGRGIQAVVIDFNQPGTLRTAFEGCETLWLLAPNALNQTELELNAVEAAMAAGVRLVVKQSVMGAAEESYSLANIHRPVEKAIEESGLAWTFLRPNSFMQNTVTFMAQTIKADDAFYSASGQARISHVDVRDIAAAAVTALTAPGHEGMIYTLSGPEALTYDDMAEELSKGLGREIRHISLPPADLKAGMLAEGMPEAIADRMLDLERYFRENRASCITNDVRRVTGREPGRFAQYVQALAPTGVWNAEVAYLLRGDLRSRKMAS